jgi:hypothetical protein
MYRRAVWYPAGGIQPFKRSRGNMADAREKNIYEREIENYKANEKPRDVKLRCTGGKRGQCCGIGGPGTYQDKVMAPGVVFMATEEEADKFVDEMHIAERAKERDKVHTKKEREVMFKAHQDKLKSKDAVRAHEGIVNEIEKSGKDHAAKG